MKIALERIIAMLGFDDESLANLIIRDALYLGRDQIG
jgi:hypothetical protein